MLVWEISATFNMTYETDITGYGRKMGRNAGLSSEGRLLGVFKIGNTWVPENTISARTMNPSNTESGGGVGLIGNYWSKPRWVSQDTTYYGAEEKGTLKEIHPELNDPDYPT